MLAVFGDVLKFAIYCYSPYCTIEPISSELAVKRESCTVRITLNIDNHLQCPYEILGRGVMK